MADKTIDGEQVRRAGAPLYLLWKYLPLLPLVDSIRDAAERLLAKEGIAANVCLMRPDAYQAARAKHAVAGGDALVLDGVTVRPREGVQGGTMWVGWERAGGGA
jgi:hypothetical protein